MQKGIEIGGIETSQISEQINISFHFSFIWINIQFYKNHWIKLE